MRESRPPGHRGGKDAHRRRPQAFRCCWRQGNRRAQRGRGTSGGRCNAQATSSDGGTRPSTRGRCSLQPALQRRLASRRPPARQPQPGPRNGGPSRRQYEPCPWGPRWTPGTAHHATQNGDMCTRACPENVHRHTPRRDQAPRHPDGPCILHSFQCPLGFQMEAGETGLLRVYAQSLPSASAAVCVAGRVCVRPQDVPG